MLKYLFVPVIIVCAIGGTVGILKLMGKFFPNGVPRDPITKKIEDAAKNGIGSSANPFAEKCENAEKGKKE